MGGWVDAESGETLGAGTVITNNSTWTATWTELLPALPAGATPAQVAAALEAAGIADPGVAAAIGGDAGRYNEFVAWAEGIEGGKEAACESATACASWLLGQSMTLAAQPVIRILLEGVEAATATNPTALTIGLRASDAWGGPVWGDYRRLGYAIFGASDLRAWEEKRVAVEATPVTTATYVTNGIFRVVPKEAGAERVFLRVGGP